MSRVIVFSLSKMLIDTDDVTVPLNNAPTNHNVTLGDSSISDNTMQYQELQTRQAVYR
jgi:hypothetical protein